MKNRLFCIACLLLASSSSFGETRTWSGKWNNRKYGTSGPLKCVAEQTDSGRWRAVFTGTYKGDPFKYRVEFASKPKSGGEALSGTATISGHPYKWEGSIIKQRLTGKYTSTNGNNGTFTLLESKRRSPTAQRHKPGLVVSKPAD